MAATDGTTTTSGQHRTMPLSRARTVRTWMRRAAPPLTALALITAVATATVANPAGASGSVALTVVSVEPVAFDVYVDGALVTPPTGAAARTTTPAGSTDPGPATVTFYLHEPAPPASDVGRPGGTPVPVTIPDVAAATIVIGPSPAGGAVPTATVWPSDSPPLPADRGRFVLRHTADLPPMDVEVVSMATVPWETLALATVGRGQELVVDVPIVVSAFGAQPTQLVITAKTQGSTFAVPPLLSTFALVPSGRTTFAYLTEQPPGPVSQPVACPSVGAVPPAGASSVSSIDADVDGDGGLERVSTWSEVNGTTEWFLGVSLPGGGSVITPLTGPEVGPNVSLAGAADANDDGRDEVFVAVRGDAVGTAVQIWGLVSCGWVPTTIEGSAGAVTFSIGATATESLAGLRCSYPGETSPELTTYEIASAGGGWQLTVASWWWAGLVLRPSGPPQSDVIAPSDPAYAEVTGDGVLARWARTMTCGVPLGDLITQEVGPPATPPSAPTPTPIAPRFTG